MDDTLDRDGIITKLQDDLIQARLEIVRLRNKRLLSNINLKSASSFIRDNYVVCLFMVMAIYYIGMLLIEMKRAIRWHV